MASLIETDRMPASGTELIGKVQRALERADLSQIQTHDAVAQFMGPLTIISAN